MTAPPPQQWRRVWQWQTTGSGVNSIDRGCSLRRGGARSPFRSIRRSKPIASNQGWRAGCGVASALRVNLEQFNPERHAAWPRAIRSASHPRTRTSPRVTWPPRQRTQQGSSPPGLRWSRPQASVVCIELPRRHRSAARRRSPPQPDDRHRGAVFAFAHQQCVDRQPQEVEFAGGRHHWRARAASAAMLPGGGWASAAAPTAVSQFGRRQDPSDVRCHQLRSRSRTSPGGRQDPNRMASYTLLKLQGARGVTMVGRPP